jgi:hypothetical protein
MGCKHGMESGDVRKQRERIPARHIRSGVAQPG